ncbi:MAG TPA: hypothetical protein VFF73_25915, partial [Planctomycetota bacterium]|nr:hypothetical protein [Planctomycetota bacterium]
VAHAGGSDASVFDEAVYFVRRGRVELTQTFHYTVSGDGRDSFVFTVPEGFEVTEVNADLLRTWQVVNGVLEVSLKHPCGKTQDITVQGEAPHPNPPPAARGEGVLLPEVFARAVSREEGRFAVSVEPGLKVRFGKDDGLRQIDPSEVGPKVRVAAERAYAFSKRPAKLGFEILDEALELRCSSRVLGTVRSDRFEVEADLEYTVKKGKTYELRVLVPSELELVGDPDGLDVRERVALKVASGMRYTFGLAKALAAGGNGVLRLHLQRAVRGDDVRVSVPDVRALDVAQEDGEIALCVAEGLRLKSEKDVESDRFSSADPEPVARDLKAASDVKPQLGWRRKHSSASGLSAATVAIEHPAPHVEGTAVTFVNVERDVFHTAVRVFYDVTEAGAREFLFRIPARLQKRISVVAPNQRELTFSAEKDGLVDMKLELQSAVRNFYELTMEWEDRVPVDGAIDLERLDLVGCDRVRAFVLVEADPSLTDKLEAAPAQCANVERARPEQAYALPPGKDPRDFAECFRAEKPEWKVGLALRHIEQQAPAPCRVETARVTSVIHEDGSVLHQAVYRVRNRNLQFLGVKLPKGAEVWTVHVAGEPKRVHYEKGVTLIPLPKRADADMGFEVQVVFKTQLEGGLGLLTKVNPHAPVLATPGVTVERTFWSLYLPKNYDALWTSGNMDETVAAISEAQQVKAEVQELSKLSSIARSARNDTERQIAYGNVQRAYQTVRGRWSLANEALQKVQHEGKQGKVQQQLAQLKTDFAGLQAQLDDVAKQQQASVPAGTRDGKEQLEVTFGTNKFVARSADEWRASVSAFKGDRTLSWEGESVQDQIDQLSAQKNRGEDEKAEAGRKFDNERRQDESDRATKEAEIRRLLRTHNSVLEEVDNATKYAFTAHSEVTEADLDELVRALKIKRDQELQERIADEQKALDQAQNLEADAAARKGRVIGGGAGGGGANQAGELIEEARKALKNGDQERAKQLYANAAKLEELRRATRDYAKRMDEPEAPPAPPATTMPQNMPSPDQPGFARLNEEPSGDPSKAYSGFRVVDDSKGGPSPNKPIRLGRVGVGNGYMDMGGKGEKAGEEGRRKLDEAEGKAFLSIGFQFEVPAGVEPLHFTTDSNSEDGPDLSLTVAPRSSFDRASRAGRALVVVLLLIAVARLGLVRAPTQAKTRRALALVVAGALAGLVFVHVAFAALAVLASIAALVRARSLRAA